MNINMELYEKTSHLQWLLHKQHLKTYTAAGPIADASRGQGRILAFLKIKDGISTRDLSYLLNIRISSLNELLAKLEKSGYILRKPSETDKRIMLIYLTEKGREEEEEGLCSSNVFSCLSPEEQSAFGEYLDRIIASLEEELGTDDERGQIVDWMKNARERMGAEQFEKLMSIRGGMHGMRSGFGLENIKAIHAWKHKERMHGTRSGFGFDRRGYEPGDMSEDNRFDPDYYGPGSEKRGDFTSDNPTDKEDK